MRVSLKVIIFCALWVIAVSMGVRGLIHSPATETQALSEITKAASVRSVPLVIEPYALAIPELSQEQLNQLAKKTRLLDTISPRYLPDILHALRLFGAEDSAVGYISSARMLQIVLDSKYHEAYYDNPHSFEHKRKFLTRTPAGFVVTRALDPADRSFPSHHEKLFQVAGEIGLSSDTRVRVDGDFLTIRDGILDALTRIHLNQELEFTAVALAYYLPPQRMWTNRLGQTVSFETIAEKLIDQRSGTCFNIHRLYALTMLVRANLVEPILSDAISEEIELELKHASHLLTIQQHADGLWDSRVVDDRNYEGLEGGDKELLHVTGHHLEWIALAPPHLRPNPSVVEKAAVGLNMLILRMPPQTLNLEYGPFSHAVRALVLLSGKKWAGIPG
jgi:hypothetical protein